LTTYDKQWDIIVETELYVGQCGGADCGWTCSETIKINENYKIFAVDSVTIRDCDDVGGNIKKSIFYKSGHIDDKGIVGLIAMWDIPPRWYPISLIVLTLPAAWLGGKMAIKK